MDRIYIKEKIMSLLHMISNNHKEIDLSINYHLINELGMTSIVFVYLLLKLEDEFSIEINNVAFLDIVTLDDLVELIESKIL